VLLRTVDFTPRERLAGSMGMSRIELEQLVFGGESGDKAQLGEITVNQHYKNLRMQLGYSPEQLQTMLEVFFSQDFLDEHLVDYVRRLHSNHKTSLLSNASDDLRRIIAERWHFEDAFDDMVISAEVKLAKPDTRIFQLAIERLQVEPGDAVFVDDMPRNVEGAMKAGLQAVHFQTPEQLRHDLGQLLNGPGG
jgi:epoxide hydrolase-like predicted phosphatase